MDVRVHCKNTQIDDATRRLAEEKVRHASRIFGDGADTDVEFTERHNPRIAGRYRVEITSWTKGHTVRVEAAAGDDVTALDLAVDKFEHQLRRLKERLIQRSRPQGSERNDIAPAGDSTSEPGDDRPIVRTKRFELRPMSVDEASLQMDMLGHDFFFFLDAVTGKYCVIYHRHDGSLGLIEPA